MYSLTLRYNIFQQCKAAFLLSSHSLDNNVCATVCKWAPLHYAMVYVLYRMIHQFTILSLDVRSNGRLVHTVPHRITEQLIKLSIDVRPKCAPQAYCPALQISSIFPHQMSSQAGRLMHTVPHGSVVPISLARCLAKQTPNRCCAGLLHNVLDRRPFRRTVDA